MMYVDIEKAKDCENDTIGSMESKAHLWPTCLDRNLSKPIETTR